MNEIFDKLIIRVLIAIIICALLYLYKFAHLLLYPTANKQVNAKFFPAQNSADSIHFFSRIIGIGIIFSSINFDIGNGIMIGIVDLCILSAVSFILYLASLFIVDGIALYNFEYEDEILKRKNHCYATIAASNAVALGFIINKSLLTSNGSLILILFMWLLAIALFGFSSKLYFLLSRFQFNKLIIQKNMALAFSYSGYILGFTMVIVSSIDQPVRSIENYTVNVILKIILSLIIFPIFRYGIIHIFSLTDVIGKKGKNDTNLNIDDPNMGQGIFEGALLFTSFYLTTVITGYISYGKIYPEY
ncbi:MAG: hypothetical protein HOE90_18810 [Bacteriovoracaceae bacterium]|nr:hypothetical protein [Bacteriovoracaceae bacterium]